MTISVQAGQQLTASVRATNTSTRLGQAVAANLSVTLGIAKGSTPIVSAAVQSYGFGPAGVHDFQFTFAIPASAPAGDATIFAQLLDPSGNIIKSASGTITITAPGGAAFVLSTLRLLINSPAYFGPEVTDQVSAAIAELPYISIADLTSIYNEFWASRYSFTASDSRTFYYNQLRGAITAILYPSSGGGGD